MAISYWTGWALHRYARPMVRYATAPYTERAGSLPGPIDLRAAAAWGGLAARWSAATGIEPFAQTVRNLAAQWEACSDVALLAEAAALRPALLRGSEPLLPRVFALAHVAVERHLGLRFHAVQLTGGRLLTERRVVEMGTGEGKTITALLAATASALAGQPVHVVTVNDYLARRDAERLRPVYAALGLTVGLVQEGDEIPERRAAYTADITYVTNKEVAFDYLKDRIASGGGRGGARNALSAALGDPGSGLILRGLHTALVDEVDSVLIDEARTPLIISEDRSDPALAAMIGQVLDVAAGLRRGEDFRLDEARRTVVLLPAGQASVAERLQAGQGLFRARFAREQLVAQALTALHVFGRDRDYIVRDGSVQIVDEYTGRVMPDRTWEQGLHQMVEAKEGVPPTDARRTLARITYQRLFNRYMRLSGMTGTARETAGELRAVYGLRTVRVPPNRPLRRRSLGGRLLPGAAAKWPAVATAAARVAAQGRPVLIGTQTVADSEALSAVLAAAGTPHVVLNARQDQEEAELVAQAGLPSRITVATNMAGRGTDIELAPGVAQRGGLHVILTEFSDSARIDRQLFGRAGRQGDPGSFEIMVALDDGLFRRFGTGLARVLRSVAVPNRLALLALRLHAQAAASRSNARDRRQQVAFDTQTERALGFAGRE